ncbi:DNA polymerase III subunit gamma and tau [Dermacoccaceae bacterium W4C1]
MTTALYRRYRPDTFADMIGQDHVTEPLMRALDSGRVNHAYLFSGPRGCGKTTSARILARCLNCAQGPTSTPCGECDSCVALARGGAGSVDVIEIDAASNGGVDDARDLRERASYGPANSRYKVYIIDEAHMVTPQGFNALLKIVEEPPEHVKFVFATTEPEKVIGTIRSRTHHYPFRLVPPGVLADYAQSLCDAENVPVEPGVMSFVTRAGGGSVRDSLSVLDQLIAGSGAEGVTYAMAASLLGFTDGELLDAVVDAFAGGDAAAVFRQIDKVVESGSDPRRFVEDLLERLRDLIVVAAVPDGVDQVLRHLPVDQLDRMRQQAAAYGPGGLSRAADIANAGLTEMTGATSPRLQLELIAARILLPASSGEQGYAARLDRLERRMEVGGAPTGDPRASAPTGRPAAAPATEPAPQPSPAQTPADRAQPEPTHVAAPGCALRTTRRAASAATDGAQSAGRAGCPAPAVRAGSGAGCCCARGARGGVAVVTLGRRPGHRCGPSRLAGRARPDRQDQAGHLDPAQRARAGRRLRRAAPVAGHQHPGPGRCVPARSAPGGRPAGVDRRARPRLHRRGAPARRAAADA